MCHAYDVLLPCVKFSRSQLICVSGNTHILNYAHCIDQSLSLLSSQKYPSLTPWSPQECRRCCLHQALDRCCSYHAPETGHSPVHHHHALLAPFLHPLPWGAAGDHQVRDSSTELHSPVSWTATLASSAKLFQRDKLRAAVPYCTLPQHGAVCCTWWWERRAAALHRAADNGQTAHSVHPELRDSRTRADDAHVAGLCARGRI